MKPLGLYIHIPFCKAKCIYCDFYSLPRAEEQMDAYVAALRRDIAKRTEAADAYTVDTVYFGGGTPTCLPPEVLCGLLATVLSRYNVAENAEITTECNPGTVTPGDLVKLREGGFNRLSMGLQSAQAGELRALGRLHSFADFAETFRAARAAGFANLSADVMFGIPHQTAESFADTLEKLCDLRPDHVSAYALTVEEGTPFGRRGAAALNLPDEEAVRDMYLGMVEFLGKRGLAQYEISNFARAGYESRHNLKYWTLGEYAGFGPGAHSDFGGVRYGYTRDLDGYLAGRLDLAESETISAQEREMEYIMLRLRTVQGIDTREFESRFRQRFGPLDAILDTCAAHGLAQRTDTGWRLTPKGFLVSNRIIGDLQEELHREKAQRLARAAQGDYRVLE